VITYSATISACELSGRTLEALSLFRTAQSEGHFQSVTIKYVPEAQVDLHDLSASVARTVVRSILQELLELSEKDHHKAKSSVIVLEIITGRGLHSQDGEAVLKPAILTLFQKEYAHKYTCRVNKKNPGRLLVSTI